MFGVKTSNYKYVRARDDPKQDLRLYDLKNDPQELKNLASIKPDVIIMMEKMLTKILAKALGDLIEEEKENGNIETTQSAGANARPSESSPSLLAGENRSH